MLEEDRGVNHFAYESTPRASCCPDVAVLAAHATYRELVHAACISAIACQYASRSMPPLRLHCDGEPRAMQAAEGDAAMLRQMQRIVAGATGVA
jgi:hypothetical protein